jgi:hypothetical protein
MFRGQAFQKTKTKTKTKNPRKQTKFKNECDVLSFKKKLAMVSFISSSVG